MSITAKYDHIRFFGIYFKLPFLSMFVNSIKRLLQSFWWITNYFRTDHQHTTGSFVIDYLTLHQGSKIIHNKRKIALGLTLLIPKSDQHEISPYNINALEYRVFLRIEVMIREDESNWYFNKFSPLLLLRMYRDSKWESQFWY